MKQAITKSQTALVRAAGLKAATPGDCITVKLDLCIVSNGADGWLDSFDPDKDVFDRDRILAVIDHESPASNLEDANKHSRIIDFSRDHGTLFTQSCGVGYRLAEKMLLQPGMLVASCGKRYSIAGAAGCIAIRLSEQEMGVSLSTGKAEIMLPETVLIRLEGVLPELVDGKDLSIALLGSLGKDKLNGKLVECIGDLSAHDRRIVCGMLAEAEVASAMFVNAPEGEYAAVYSYDIGAVESMVALPGDVFAGKSAFSTFLFEVQAIYIGGCMSGELEDLRIAAEILKGKTVRDSVRLMISAVDKDTYVAAMNEGIITALMESGAYILPAGCGACNTQSYGMIGDGEIMLSAGGFNYCGCCGSMKGSVYLTSVRVAATTALTGHISVF